MMNTPDLSQTLDMSKSKPIQCDNCKNLTFKQTLMLSKLSALVSPNGQETIVPSAVFACEACNHVNREFTEKSSIEM